jgi:hypothetical protein
MDWILRIYTVDQRHLGVQSQYTKIYVFCIRAPQMLFEIKPPNFGRLKSSMLTDLYFIYFILLVWRKLSSRQTSVLERKKEKKDRLYTQHSTY